MYAYRILLCSLLVLSTAATYINVSQEDWNKLIVSAKGLCKCSNNTIEGKEFEECKLNETNIFIGLGSKALPIEKVCGDIRDINNKLKDDDLDEPHLSKNDTKLNCPDVGGTNGTNCTKADVKAINGTDGLEPSVTNTDEKAINGTGFGRNGTNFDKKVINGTDGVRIKMGGINGSVTDKIVIDNVTKLNEANKSETSLNVTKNLNSNESGIVNTNFTGPIIKPDVSTSTEKIPNPEGGAIILPPEDKPHKYSLSVLLWTLFCSFGAGILIAVGSKILYSRYRARTYEIPAEQELH